LGQSRWRSTPPACFAQVEDHGAEGAVSGRVFGTYLHGATESASVLNELLGIAVEPTGPDGGFDALADWFEEHATGFVERFL
jgi:cobyric acid synthase